MNFRKMIQINVMGIFRFKSLNKLLQIKHQIIKKCVWKVKVKKIIKINLVKVQFINVLKCNQTKISFRVLK